MHLEYQIENSSVEDFGYPWGEEQMVGWAGNANAKVEESRSKKLPVLKIAEKILRRILVAPFFFADFEKHQFQLCKCISLLSKMILGWCSDENHDYY